MRGVLSFSAIAFFVTLVGVWLAAESRAQTGDKPSVAGAWTLAKDLSDPPPARGDDGGNDRRGDGRVGRGGFGRGGGFGGGRRRGGGGGYGGNGGGNGDNGRVGAEDAARMRDAMRDILNPPDHLVVTQTDSMIVMTAPDGRTTRLSPDGKKIKDENTNIERKTKWDGAKLVSEISGIGRGKITQRYWVDAEHHQLHVALEMEGGRSGQPRTINRIYDADSFTR